MDVDSVRRLKLVGVLTPADVLHAVLTDVQSIQLEYNVESADLSDNQSHDYRPVVAFALAPVNACDAVSADVQLECKLQRPFAYPGPLLESS